MPKTTIDFDESSGRTFIPDNKFTPIKTEELDQKTQEQMNEFSELLGSLDNSLDKKKKLWRQIYENAVTDRKNAYIVFTDLYIQVHGKATEHAIHGQTITKYMERMSRATDQLIKLAELVAAAEENSMIEETTSITQEDIYSKIIGKTH